MARIKLSEYSDATTSMVQGEQIRVNHTECGDTRRRLYIKKLTDRDNTLLAYCHNCSTSGRLKGTRHYSVNRIVNKLTDTQPPSLPDGFFVGEPGFHARPYLDNDIKCAAFSRLKGRYDPIEERYCIPIYNVKGEYVGLNSRGKYNNGPKYRLETGDKFPGYQIVQESDIDTVIVVYVEDQLSAAILAELEGVAGVALFGTKGKIEMLHEVASMYGKDVTHIVWLDNDNEQVCKTADNMYQYLSLLGYKTRKVTVQEDPKNMSRYRGIRAALEGELV